jgi:hypothetical protein
MDFDWPPIPNGTLVKLSDRYWAEPSPGRHAVVTDYWVISNLYVVRPYEDGKPVHYTCTRPASMLAPVTGDFP